MEKQETRVCHDCKKEKSIIEFIGSKKTGRLRIYCKECKREHDKKYRNSEKGKQTRRKYQQYYGRTPQRKAYVKKRNSRPDVKQKMLDSHKVLRNNDVSRMKDNARNKAKYAVKRGRILKEPCLICGNQDTTLHHPNYNNPLYVIWLCNDCHENIDKILKYDRENFLKIVTEYKIPELPQQNKNTIIKTYKTVNNLKIRYSKRQNKWQTFSPDHNKLAEFPTMENAIDYAKNITTFLRRKYIR